MYNCCRATTRTVSMGSRERSRERVRVSLEGGSRLLYYEDPLMRGLDGRVVIQDTRKGSKAKEEMDQKGE